MQAYAMQTVLERMGHEAWIIDYYSNPDRIRSPWYRDMVTYPIRFFKKYFLGQKRIKVRTESYYRNSFKALSMYVAPFLEKNIKRRKFDRLKSIKEGDFDIIVVGSDQIWNDSGWNKDGFADKFLSFAKDWNTKRISYAASFGHKIWRASPEITRTCAVALKTFDAVSVREDTGVVICREKFGVEARIVLDPTLLLAKEEYLNLLKGWKECSRPSGSMMTYVLDKSKETDELVTSISKKTGLTPFETCGCKKIRLAGHLFFVNEALENWLSGFRDADFIVTDSFHACVFSIIFRKPFLVVLNKDRGTARIYSLLKMLRLENHLIESEGQFTRLCDYEISADAENALSEWQKKSWKFLFDNVGKGVD